MSAALGSINFPHPIVDQKVKYFRDQFEYLVENIGTRPDLPLENHLHLCERILFQLTMSRNPKNTFKVKHFQNHSLLSAKDYLYKDKYEKDILEIKDLIAKVSSGKRSSSKKTIRFWKVGLIISKLKNVIPNFLHDILKKDVDETDYTQILIKKLKDWQTDLKSNYFRHCLDNVISILTCEHPLEKHQGEIRYYSRMLVSEFIFSGFQESDLVGLGGAFWRILSRKVTKDEDGVHTYFPLSEELLTYRDDPNFYQRVKQFIDNRNFQDQFLGLANLYNRKQFQLSFLFQLPNIVFDIEDRKEDVVVGDCALINPKSGSLSINEIQGDLEEKKILASFCNEPEKTILRVDVECMTRPEGFELARLKAEEFLGHFERITGYKVLINEVLYYSLYENDQGFGWSRKPKTQRINKWHIPELEQVHFSSQHPLLATAEPMLAKAARVRDEAEKLVFFWAYLERLFVFLEGEPDKGHQISNYIASILLLEEEENTKNQMELDLHNWLINSDLEVINISMSPAELRMKLNRWEISVDEISTLTDYPTIVEHIKTYQNYKLTNNIRNFYSHLAKEAYEQRNRFIHSDKNFDKSVLQVIRIFPSMIYRLRSILSEKLSLNGVHDGWESELKALKLDGNKLI